MAFGLLGVSDGTRTRDIRDHNAALYQLSYTHHRPTVIGQRKVYRARAAGLYSAAPAD